MAVADYAGTAVFAAQGALLAVRAGLDIFGVLVLAFTVALGGGIIRDLIIGDRPPAAFASRRYPVIAAAAATAVMLLHLAGLAWPAGVVRVLDAAGLALFAVAGTRKAQRFGLAAIPAVLLGVVTGVGGGVLRDVFLNIVPGVLRTDIYATAAMAGAAAMVGAQRLGLRVVDAAVLGGVTCFALRMLAVAYGWRLPAF